MTRPAAPRPLASVRRLPTPTPAEQTQAMLPVAELLAMQRAISAAAQLHREIYSRKGRQEHRVPMDYYQRLGARLDELNTVLREGKS